MSAFKPQQRYLNLNGRRFHFVSYEGHPENLARNVPSEPPMWYLMLEGRRHPVLPFTEQQTPEQVDQLLGNWLEANGLLDRSLTPPA